MGREVRCSGRLTNVLVDRLRNVRVSREIKLETLAATSGYGKTTVTEWESGKHIPSVSALTDWANALGYDLTLVRRKN